MTNEAHEKFLFSKTLALAGTVADTLFAAAAPAAFTLTTIGFTTIDVPGAVESGAYGINDAGQIVGMFSAAASPVPEPSSLALLGVGIGLTGIATTCRRVISPKPL